MRFRQYRNQDLEIPPMTSSKGWGISIKMETVWYLQRNWDISFRRSVKNWMMMRWINCFILMFVRVCIIIDLFVCKYSGWTIVTRSRRFAGKYQLWRVCSAYNARLIFSLFVLFAFIYNLTLIFRLANTYLFPSIITNHKFGCSFFYTSIGI